MKYYGCNINLQCNNSLAGAIFGKASFKNITDDFQTELLLDSIATKCSTSQMGWSGGGHNSSLMFELKNIQYSAV